MTIKYIKIEISAKVIRCIGTSQNIQGRCLKTFWKSVSGRNVERGVRGSQFL